MVKRQAAQRKSALRMMGIMFLLAIILPVWFARFENLELHCAAAVSGGCVLIGLAAAFIYRLDFSVWPWQRITKNDR